MAKITAGVADSTNMFNLNGLDYSKNRYEIYYTNKQNLPSGELDTSLIKVGLRDIISKEPIQSPLEIGVWVNSSDVPYSTLTGLVKDLITLVGVGFNTPQVSGVTVEVNSTDDLPESISGVITLEDNKAYRFSGLIDLLGDRIVGGVNTSLLGITSENSFLTSTGLGEGVALFTTVHTTPIQNLSIINVDTVFDISGTASSAYDWDKFNIIDCPNIGTINGCSNWILTNSAFLNSSGLKFDGTIGTIGIDNSLYVGDGEVSDMIEILPTCNITRRFRPIYSSFVSIDNNTAINFSDSATIPTEAYILDTINFSGNGTYLSGVQQDSNKTLFNNCVGIVNTSVNGQLYMRDNLTSTSIVNTVDFVKVAGTTLGSTDNSKYEVTDNRLTCKAIVERKYSIMCTLNFSSGNNNECEFGFYDSKLGQIRQPSIQKSTANASGRSENVTFVCAVQHGFDDYLEIHCRNTTSATDITVTSMNFLITEIK